MVIGGRFKGRLLFATKKRDFLYVGLSNKLDKEVKRRKPVKRPHRKVVGAAVVKGKLSLKIKQRKERMERIKALLVFPVAALHLTIVPWGIRTDQFMLDAQLSGSFLKKGRDIPFAVGKAVGKRKAVVCLDTLHTDSPACVPLHQPFQKVGRGASGLLRIGG